MSQRKAVPSVKTEVTSRASGILCHLTSLPGPHFNGDLSFDTCRWFIDWLASAGQSLWQVLPLNPIGSGHSPYSSVCSYAGDPLFIGLNDLMEEGLLQRTDLRPLPTNGSHLKVNYAKARKFRMKVLRIAYQRFEPTRDFHDFCTSQSHWLEEFALFCAIVDQNDGNAQWQLWHPGLRSRDAAALAQARAQLADQLAYHKFLQFKFFQQWQRVKTYANQHGIQIIGDIPIFVAHESSDVWGAQANFLLNSDGSPKFVAGVPPDYFNTEGQLWGNALFDWQYMKTDGFSWWLSRLQHMTQMFDIVRLDHFIGFYRYWEIPAGAPNAKKGTWRLAEGEAMLNAFKSKFGSLPFIAEDLGIVTPEVTALREAFSLPAMKVLQLGFGNDESAPDHLPHNFSTSNCVFYTGTHDNDTTAGWYEAARRNAKKSQPSYNFARIKAYAGQTKEPTWRFVEDVMKSIAKLAVIPLQDVLGLGSNARMNVPGTVGKNWVWRMDKKQVTAAKAKTLFALGEATDRLRGSD